MTWGWLSYLNPLQGDQPFPTLLPVLAFLGTMLFTKLNLTFWQERRKREKNAFLREQCAQMVDRVFSGRARDDEFFTHRFTRSNNFIGWEEMFVGYHTYMQNLPVYTRCQLIDKLLNSKALGMEDQPPTLVAVIQTLSQVERMTIRLAIGADKPTIENTSLVANELANDLIAFMLGHPH